MLTKPLFCSFLFLSIFQTHVFAATTFNVSPCDLALTDASASMVEFLNSDSQLYTVFLPKKTLPPDALQELQQLFSNFQNGSNFHEVIHFYSGQRKDFMASRHGTFSDQLRDAAYEYIEALADLTNDSLPESEKKFDRLVPERAMIHFRQSAPEISERVSVHRDGFYVSFTQSFFGKGTWLSPISNTPLFSIEIRDLEESAHRLNSIAQTPWLEVPEQAILTFSGNERAEMVPGKKALPHTSPLIHDGRITFTLFLSPRNPGRFVR